VSLECANSRVPLSLLGLLSDKEILLGAIDVAALQVETPDQVADVIRQAMAYVDPERILPCTNCGMAPLPRMVAIGKLRALGAGAALVRKNLGR
jgi:5-methyltetrahydropteroyltriglutamate--homocysteine methyltransferase